MADFPVFVIEDGQIRRKQLLRDDNVDLYSNETTGSSFVVRKSSNRTQFILDGIFYDGLDQLQLTRDPRGDLHRIHKQTREVDFQDDYVNTIINEGVTPRTDGSTRPPPIYKSHARGKRQLDTGGEHEIRLFMVADYKDYKT
ncbi:unnamed protein product [Lymnaea stagnalis]|uniref:Uncharacterized protein n=1 Tax=Lymnaea stagnalis TaxID=6523 RepID=A0AAV2HY58_LYMST